MSESQSRYSIVERLTKTKIDIMEAKAGLKERVKEAEQKAAELKKELSDWEKDWEVEKAKNKRDMERDIRKAETSAANMGERLKDKEKVYDEKLKAIDVALQSIETISKTSEQK